MLSLIIPLLVGPIVPWIVFSEKDKRLKKEAAQRGNSTHLTRYTLGRVAFTAWFVGMFFLVAIISGVCSAIEDLPPNGALMIQILLLSMIPVVMRRLQNIGWSAWWSMSMILALIPVVGGLTIWFVTALFFIPGKPDSQLPIASVECSKVMASPIDSAPITFASIGNRQASRQEQCTTLPRKQTTRITPQEHVVETYLDNSPRQPPPLPKTRITKIGPITFSQNDQTFGPYEAAVVVSLWDQGQIAGNALYWHDQLDDWKSLASDIEALRLI